MGNVGNGFHQFSVDKLSYCPSLGKGGHPNTFNHKIRIRLSQTGITGQNHCTHTTFSESFFMNRCGDSLPLTLANRRMFGV